MHRCSAPTLRALARLALLSSLALGCAGTATVVQPTSPFTAEDARLFDRGVSYIAEPDALGGGWEVEWVEALEMRVQRADAIALVTGHTYREDQNPRRERTFRLTMTLAENLYGEVPEELELVSRSGSPGFDSVEGQEQRILQQRFVAFVKWQLNEESGAVEAAFHLEPASESVLGRVRQLVERMHGVSSGPRTTVHYN